MSKIFTGDGQRSVQESLNGQDEMNAFNCNPHKKIRQLNVKLNFGCKFSQKLLENQANYFSGLFPIALFILRL